MEDKPIHISRGGKELGQFPPDEIVKHLSSGLLMRTDLAWQDGMTEWKPIYEIVGVQQSHLDDLPHHWRAVHCHLWQFKKQGKSRAKCH